MTIHSSVFNQQQQTIPMIPIAAIQYSKQLKTQVFKENIQFPMYSLRKM